MGVVDELILGKKEDTPETTAAGADGGLVTGAGIEGVGADEVVTRGVETLGVGEAFALGASFPMFREETNDALSRSISALSFIHRSS